MSKYVLMSRILRIINTFWKRYQYEDLRLSWEEKRIRRKNTPGETYEKNVPVSSGGQDAGGCKVAFK